jgi:hypothetical protein
MQPTHHKESSMIDEAYQGNVSKLFDEAYKGNVFKLTIKNGKDNAVDVDLPGTVATYKPEDHGQEYSNTKLCEEQGEWNKSKSIHGRSFAVHQRRFFLLLPFDGLDFFG